MTDAPAIESDQAPKAEDMNSPAPNEMRDPFVRQEFKRASVWIGLAAALALIVLLIQPLLLIFAGLVFATMLDGGVRLLGRVLPIGRGWRLMIVVILFIVFVVGTIYMTGVQLAEQVAQLRTTLEVQWVRLSAWLTSLGVMPGVSDLRSLASQVMGSVGRLTSAVGTAAGAIGSLFLLMVIGLFVAMEPRIYERGMAWLIPTRHRDDFSATIGRMAFTMRRLMAGRLLGMLFEGVLTWIALSLGGVPMALLLGIITGILAFIPNIGAITAGVLMVAVGFSAGVDTGLWAIATYFIIQTFDGYVLLPLVAKKTVDLPPALTLSTQIIAGTLFGILGVALADPLTAMIKVALEDRSKRGG